MGSFYRSIAKALGVADSLSRKDTEVRELVERTLQTSRLMLVFDEAHNLFSGCRRLRREPGRILWLRRLVDGGVPIAFVALPDFKTRVARYVDQLDWDAAQITDIIARECVLPGELLPADFELLVARLAPDFSASTKSVIASAAKGQRGAQYVADVVRVALHLAQKAGRPAPSDADVADAIGGRPQFHSMMSTPEVRGRGRSRVGVASVVSGSPSPNPADESARLGPSRASIVRGASMVQ